MAHRPRPSLALAALGVAAAGLLTLAPHQPGLAQDGKFTKTFLKNPVNIALGKEVWGKRCKFCHGRGAYPGKGPTLDPSRLEPGFIYDRVTNGFRGMPAWKDEFSEKERRAVAAYILSKDFEY